MYIKKTHLFIKHIINRYLIAFWMLLFIFLSCNNSIDNEDLGTFSHPEDAYDYTVKTLNFISETCNNGIESATYLNEYENTKQTIFKNIDHEKNIQP